MGGRDWVASFGDGSFCGRNVTQQIKRTAESGGRHMTCADKPSHTVHIQARRGDEIHRHASNKNQHQHQGQTRMQVVYLAAFLSQRRSGDENDV